MRRLTLDSVDEGIVILLNLGNCVSSDTECKSQKTWITNAKHATEKLDQESATEQPTM